MGLEVLIILLNPLTPIIIYATYKIITKYLPQPTTKQYADYAQKTAQPILQKTKYWACEYCKTKNTEQTQLCQKCGAPQWSNAT